MFLAYTLTYSYFIFNLKNKPPASLYCGHDGRSVVQLWCGLETILLIYFLKLAICDRKLFLESENKSSIAEFSEIYEVGITQEKPGILLVHKVFPRLVQNSRLHFTMWRYKCHGDLCCD